MMIIIIVIILIIILLIMIITMIIMIGALFTIMDRLTYLLAMVGVSLSFETIQKSALLGSAHILRKLLEIKR